MGTSGDNYHGSQGQSKCVIRLGALLASSTGAQPSPRPSLALSSFTTVLPSVLPPSAPEEQLGQRDSGDPQGGYKGQEHTGGPYPARVGLLLPPGELRLWAHTASGGHRRGEGTALLAHHGRMGTDLQPQWQREWGSFTRHPQVGGRERPRPRPAGMREPRFQGVGRASWGPGLRILGRAACPPKGHRGLGDRPGGPLGTLGAVRWGHCPPDLRPLS